MIRLYAKRVLSMVELARKARLDRSIRVYKPWMIHCTEGANWLLTNVFLIHTIIVQTPGFKLVWRARPKFFRVWRARLNPKSSGHVIVALIFPQPARYKTELRIIEK